MVPVVCRSGKTEELITQNFSTTFMIHISTLISSFLIFKIFKAKREFETLKTLIFFENAKAFFPSCLVSSYAFPRFSNKLIWHLDGRDLTFKKLKFYKRGIKKKSFLIEGRRDYYIRLDWFFFSCVSIFFNKTFFLLQVKTENGNFAKTNRNLIRKKRLRG